MVLRTATKDENVPRPRTSIMVAARDTGRSLLSKVTDNSRSTENSLRFWAVGRRAASGTCLRYGRVLDPNMAR